MKLHAQVFDQGLAAPLEGKVEGERADSERLAAQLLKQINAM
jgi:hypothetical protein